MKHSFYPALILSFACAGLLPAQQTPNRVKATADGGVMVGETGSIVGFHGATPSVRVVSADQTALTDSTGGSVSGTTLAATSGVFTLAIPVTLANVADGDVLTAYTPGHRFKVLAVSFAVSTAVTTADKLTTLNLEIGTTNLTGGAIALTSANCTPLGAAVAGSAITAANTGTSSDTISIEASSTTAFAEGAGYVLIRLQNLDTQDSFAKTAELLNALRAALVTKGIIKGSS